MSQELVTLSQAIRLNLPKDKGSGVSLQTMRGCQLFQK